MQLSDAKRIVIKIGSALLVNQDTGQPKSDWLKSLVDDVIWLKKQGKEVVIVTSGAVALGRKHVQKGNHPLKLEQKQAAAACGQIMLMYSYHEHFAAHGAEVAQILITIEDTEHRRRYLNARATIRTLLDHGLIPILNENDSVATPELRIGDNDRLSAKVAQMVEADILILLSDIDGLYTADPRKNPGATHLPEVRALTPDIRAMAGDSGSKVGTGGMRTKLASADIAMQGGCHMIIANGHQLHPVRTLTENGKCTWFVASESPQNARKHWIATRLTPAGHISIDNGAVTALQNGKSLLPAGVTEVSGQFERGDMLLVKDMSGNIIARGLSNYRADDARRIMGKKTSEVEDILGYSGRAELIHRDEMVISEEGV